MTLAFVQRADVLRPEPGMACFVQVIGVDHHVGAPADPTIRFRPLEGGAGKALTLSEFNERYPHAAVEYRDDVAATLH